MVRSTDHQGDKVFSEETSRTVEVTGAEARQGLLGRRVLLVLVGGLLLALVAWAGAEIFGEASDNDLATQVDQGPPATEEASPALQGSSEEAPAGAGNPPSSTP